MSFFCLVGGSAKEPYPEDKLKEEMWEDRYFKPGIIHGGEDYMIRVYLNDSHSESGDDHNQFEVEYIGADLILEAANADPSFGDVFNQMLCQELENFCVPSTEIDFYELCKAWDESIPMTNNELVSWAQNYKKGAV